MTWWAIDVRTTPEERGRLGAWLVARRHAREPDALNASDDTDTATGESSHPGRR